MDCSRCALVSWPEEIAIGGVTAADPVCVGTHDVYRLEQVPFERLVNAGLSAEPLSASRYAPCSGWWPRR